MIARRFASKDWAYPKRIFLAIVLIYLMGFGFVGKKVYANNAFLNSPHIAFRHILPDSLETIGYINTVAQDAQGFMWFGGNNGLARYDGYNLKIYRYTFGNPHSLSHNYVNDILLSQDGRLWVATEKGLNRYDPVQDRFDVFMRPSGSSTAGATNDVQAMLEDRQGRLWLGTRGGFHEFIRQTGEFARFFYEIYPANTGTSLIRSLVEDQHGQIWIGNQTGGLSRFDPLTSNFTHFRADPDGLSSNDIRSLFVSSDNTLWIGTFDGGLHMMDASRKRIERVAYDSVRKNQPVWAIIEDAADRLWIGEGGGLALLDKETLKYTQFTHDDGDQRSLGNHVVNDLFLDRAGDLWVGFFPSGVDMVDAQASVFRNFTHHPKNPSSILGGGLLAAHQDASGTLWLGAEFGLSRLDPGANGFTNYSYDSNKISVPNNDVLDHATLSGDAVVSIAGDDTGGLWLGIWGSGLNYFDPKEERFQYFLPDQATAGSLQGKEPWDITIARNGDVWVATELGLNRYDRESQQFEFFVPPNELIDGENILYARAVLEDRRGNLWVGSYQGLYLFNRETKQFKRFQSSATVKNSLSINKIRSLYEDSDGVLWIGTEGGGLNRFDHDTESFSAVRSRDGLPDEVVTGIIEDDEGWLWLGTHKGLVRYNPETGAIRGYDRRHGLPGNLFNRNAAAKLQDGTLVFGSTEGLTLYRASDLWVNDYVPPIVLTGFSVFNEPLSVGGIDGLLDASPWQLKEVTLQHKQSVFAISFAALNYRSPEENNYAYKLEGFDSAWQMVGKNRTASYTNIDPGTYTFKVKGANNEGVWNEVPIHLTVHIRPPLWRTWWAYLIYIVCFVLIIYFIILINLHKRTYEREHTLNKRLQDLDKLKDAFLANTSHELRTPLNGIIGLSDSLLDGAAGPVPDEIKRYIEMIAFSGRRLANLVNDILDFSKLKTHTLQLNRKPVALHNFVEIMLGMSKPLVGTKPIELINLVSNTLPAIDADENRLQQILYNLLGNAIKFTDRGNVTVSAYNDHDVVVIDVSDTGIGIPADQVDIIFESFEQVDGTTNRSHGGTGLGLAITKRLVELHGGTVSVSSKEGVGSTFRMRFPVAR